MEQFDQIRNCIKPCKTFYKIILKKYTERPINSQNKWGNLLNIKEVNWEFVYFSTRDVLLKRYFSTRSVLIKRYFSTRGVLIKRYFSTRGVLIKRYFSTRGVLIKKAL